MIRLLLILLVALVACDGKRQGAEASPGEAPAKSEPATKADAVADGKPVANDAATDERTPAAAPRHPALTDPSQATEKAPDTYKVKFDTTKGHFTVQVYRDWAPLGADRFYNLVKIGFYENIAFFRAIEGFMVQFGIHGDPEVTAQWRTARIQDDPVKESNKKGTITFATAGPNTRTTQVFINFNDNVQLDAMGFAPFGKVIDGMNVVESLHTGYGEGAPSGMGPNQAFIERRGNDYLRKSFPYLDWVKKATLLEE